jgi:hypothetical protein
MQRKQSQIRAAPVAAAATENLPDVKVMTNAFKLAISKDKPIKLDYWVDSTLGRCKIGEHSFIGDDGKEHRETLLIRNEEEYTSTVEESYKCKGSFILVTSFSIYIVSGTVETCRINPNSLRSH